MAPTALGTIHGVMAMPMKHFDRRLVGYLSREEIKALLNAPDSATLVWPTRSRHAGVVHKTGARVSELINMTVSDVVLDRSSSLDFMARAAKKNPPVAHDR